VVKFCTEVDNYASQLGNACTLSKFPPWVPEASQRI
jgi:hypothetical protein